MYKKIVCLIIVVSTLFSLTACMPMGPKATGGSLIGGAVGAVLGSNIGKGRGQLVGVALGTLAGSVIGSQLGNRLDQRDQALAQSAMRDALEHAPDNQMRQWQNPNSRHCGNVRVLRTEECRDTMLVCRDYVHTVTIDGRQEKVHGRACRDMRDVRGEWFIQN